MRDRKRKPVIRSVVVAAAAASLAVCLAAPVLYLNGRFEDGQYKAALLAGSIGWFACAGAFTATNRADGPRE